MALNARDPRFQKAVMGFLLVGGVLYTYFFTDWFSFTYKANASELTELEGEYRELSKDLNKARQAINRLPYLEKEYELLHRKWEQGRVLLPEDYNPTIVEMEDPLPAGEIHIFPNIFRLFLTLPDQKLLGLL